MPHSTELRGGVWPHSSQASRRAPLAIEEPILGWDVPSLDFHPARPGMLRTTLRRPQGVQGHEPGAPRLLTAPWLGHAWPRAPCPLERVMGWSHQGAGGWPLGGFTDRLPAGLRGLTPAAPALPVGRPCRGGATVGHRAEPLAPRQHPAALPLARAWPPRPPTVGRAVPALGQPPPGPETRAPAGMRRVGPRARRGDRPPPGPPRGSPEAR